MTFTDTVYQIVKKIPRGKVSTYKDIATMAGNPKASRAVGMAMKKNPLMPVVPCHRVVASDGSMTGYSAGEGIVSKMQMLEEEGVQFVGKKVDLQVSRWSE